MAGRRHVAVLAYIEALGEELIPWARVVVVDDDGDLVAGARVHARSEGSTTARRTCTTDADGTCSMMGERFYARPEDPAAWSWEVETVEAQGLSSPIGGLLFADLPLEVLVASMEDHEALRGTPMAVHWPAGAHPDLGHLAEAYTLPNHGTGLLSSPLGIVFTPALGLHQRHTFRVALDGSGLLSSPLGFLDVHRVSLDLSAAPAAVRARLGQSLDFVAADGSGLLSSPLGFRPMSMFTPRAGLPGWANLGGSGLLSSPLGFSSHPVFLWTHASFSSGLAGTSVGDTLAAGGWLHPSGLAAGSAMLGTGLVDEAEPEPGVASAVEAPGQRLIP